MTRKGVGIGARRDIPLFDGTVWVSRSTVEIIARYEYGGHTACVWKGVSIRTRSEVPLFDGSIQ